jgi:hypothetical protein
MEVSGQLYASPLYPGYTTPVLIEKEAGCTPEAVWRGLWKR